MINYISVFSAVQIASAEVFFGSVCSLLICSVLTYCDECNLPGGNYLGFLVVAEGSNTDWCRLKAIGTNRTDLPNERRKA